MHALPPAKFRFSGFSLIGINISAIVLLSLLMLVTQ